MCLAAAERMSQLGLHGRELRERRHLDPFVKDEFKRRTGTGPTSRRLSSPSFPEVGAVDVIVDEPPLLMELKWSYQLPGKVFESVWDAIKLTLLGNVFGTDHVYLVVGASNVEWTHTESAEAFTTGTFDPLELWNRPLNSLRGPNGGATVGEDLVIGGHGNQPIEGPRTITVHQLAAFEIASDFELRVLSLTGSTSRQPWPRIEYPPPTTPRTTGRVTLAAPGGDGSFSGHRRPGERHPSAARDDVDRGVRRVREVPGRTKAR